MKLGREKKGDARFDHVVPLSAAAMGVLEAARAKSDAGQVGLVFPGRMLQLKRVARQSDGRWFFTARPAPIAAGAIRELYERRHVPHGWRASFSTILNEELGPEWRFDIDAALGHAGKGKVEAAYNRSAQLARRRELFDRWGALLAG